jgi:hypothetical protein
MGLVAALGLFMLAWTGRKRMSFSRGDIIVILCGGLGLTLVSIDPSILNHLLFLKKQSRVLSLVVVVQFGTFLLLILLMVRLNRMKKDLGRLVHNLAVREFGQQYGTGVDYRAKILVVIPAFNEADNVQTVLGRLPAEILGYPVEAIVSVDGATDDTEAVVRDLDLPVVVNRINRGGGAALKAGYELAVRHGAEIVVTMDADGQHRPEEIETIVEPIIRGRADFVCGSRILGAQDGATPVRQAGIFFFNRLVTFLLRRRITDCSNSFRAIRVAGLARLDLQEDQFHTTELLIEAISKGLSFTEVPVTVQRRHSGSSKKPSSLSYGIGFFRAIMRTWLRT